MEEELHSTYTTRRQMKGQKHTVDQDSKTKTKNLSIFMPCDVYLFHYSGSYVVIYKDM